MKIRPWPSEDEGRSKYNEIIDISAELSVYFDRINEDKTLTRAENLRIEKLFIQNEINLNLLCGVLEYNNLVKSTGKIGNLNPIAETQLDIAKYLLSSKIKLSPRRREYIKDCLKKEKYNLVTEMMGDMSLIMEEARKKPEDKVCNEICFNTVKSTARFYRLMVNNEINFISSRIGVRSYDSLIISFADKIRSLFKRKYKDILPHFEKSSTDEILSPRILNIRANFEQSQIEVIDFYKRFNSEMGEIAQEVLRNKTGSKNKDVYYSISVYKRLPKIIIGESRSLNNELVMVHELAHAVHSVIADRNTEFENHETSLLEMEFFASFFEIMYLFEQFRKSSEINRNKIRTFVNEHFFSSLYASAFNVEYENIVWIKVGETTINTEKELSDEYMKLIKKYFSNLCPVKNDLRHDWIYHHNIFDPQLDLNYLLSFICAFKFFNMYQSFKIGPDTIAKYMSLGGRFKLNSIIDIQELILNPEVYIEEIAQAIRVG